MDRNSVIGFILIALILGGFTFYQSKQAQKAAEYKAYQDSVALAERIALGDTPDLSAQADTAVMPAAAVQDIAVYKDSSLEASRKGEAEYVTLENDLMVLTLTTRGAQPYSVKLKKYYNYDSTDLYIFRPGKSEYAVSVYTGEYINTANFNFVVKEVTDTSVVMRLPFEGGGCIEQSYNLAAGSYNVKNNLSFVGMQNVIPRNVSSVDIDFLMTIPRMEKGYKNELQYSKMDYWFEGDKKTSELGKGGRSASKRIDSKLSWFAFHQQFFSAIICAPQQFASGELAVDFCSQDDPERNLMNCSARMRCDIRPAQEVTIPVEFYFGPNDYRGLKTYDRSYEKIIPLGGWLVGWFTKYAIIPMFNWFHRYFASFGLIILLMTLVIKLVVLPLTYKSYASSAKMSALKPEMEKINARYPKQEDALKKQQATMDLYKRAGVSPMGGCLPMFLTFPILWAMFRFFPASIELRQQSFLWCHDLSAYDSIVDFGSRIPLIGDHISLFALLMAVTMFFYSKFTMSGQNAGNDPTAKSMQFMSVWMMPIMMFFICNNLSAALSYYYLLSQLIGTAEIIIIRKVAVKPEELLAKVRASEGKPLPKSKFQKRLEEAQRIQQQQIREQQKKQRR